MCARRPNVPAPFDLAPVPSVAYKKFDGKRQV